MYKEDLTNRLNKQQRSDALFATIGRYVKRVPSTFLRYIGSKCQYKSKSIRSVLKSYTKTFLKGFLVIFKCEDLPDLEYLFLDFWVLWFPESKWTTILDRILSEGAIDQSYYNLKIQEIK